MAIHDHPLMLLEMPQEVLLHECHLLHPASHSVGGVVGSACCSFAMAIPSALPSYNSIPLLAHVVQARRAERLLVQARRAERLLMAGCVTCRTSLPWTWKQIIMVRVISSQRLSNAC